MIEPKQTCGKCGAPVKPIAQLEVGQCLSGDVPEEVVAYFGDYDDLEMVYDGPRCDACPERELTAERVRAWFEEAARRLDRYTKWLARIGNEITALNVPLGDFEWGVGYALAWHIIEVHPRDFKCFVSKKLFRLCEVGAALTIAAWAHEHLDKHGNYRYEPKETVLDDAGTGGKD